MSKIVKRLQKIIKMFYNVVFLRSKTYLFKLGIFLKARKKNFKFKSIFKNVKKIFKKKEPIEELYVYDYKPIAKKSLYLKIMNIVKQKIKGNDDCEELVVLDKEDTLRAIAKRRLSREYHKLIRMIDKKTFPLRHKFKRKTIKVKSTLKYLKTEIKSLATDKLVLKMSLLVVFTLIMFSQSFSWFYNEYISNGALFTIGNISHVVKQYDKDGVFVEEVENPATIIYESNMGVTTKNTKFIEVENTGTLDMEYNITFQLDGTVADAGVLYYRLYEVTNDVEAATTDETHNTKLKAYAYANPIDPDIEEDTVKPITNMSTINNYIKKGTIHIENDSTDPNPRYYRLDYGMYQGTNSSLYSNHAFAAHISVYSTQLGLLSGGESSEIYYVSDETEFRNAINVALSGDTIRLSNDIDIAGSIDFAKRINIDTNEYVLGITGDLVYDFVETGDLTIDSSGTGKIEIGNDFYLNIPKTKVNLVGENKACDMYVIGDMTVSALQSGEEEGLLLSNVSIVKDDTSFIPIDINVLSNTRIVVAPEVTVGLIKAAVNSTNIEIINNGNITQVQMQDMNLLPTFTKPQIYIYNLGTIYGVMGGASILLPASATPYVGPTQGNTLIIKGITSSDITVDGSENFDQDDIEYNTSDDSVIPIAGETDAYIVYIKQAGVTIEQLLNTYFEANNFPDVPAKIAAINKLIVYTINGQYMGNADFDFLNSSDIPIISYLDLENARVKDGTTLNKIKDSALSGKTSLVTVLLPKTLTVIGDGAFYDVELGLIPANANDPFHFLTIPAGVTTIGAEAFNAVKYVNFKSITPPTISSDTFDNATNGTKYFVPMGAIANYQAATNITTANVFQDAYLSDNRQFFVFAEGDDIGISYYVNDTTTYSSISIPTTLDVDAYTTNVTAIGTNAYRHVLLDSGGATITLPSAVTRVDYGAFYDQNITSINLGNLTTVGDYAFYSTNLTSITANSLTTIGNHTFELTEAETASFNSLTTMGAYALASSPNLYQINLADVATIGTRALYDCKNLSRVYFTNDTAKMVNSTEEIDLTVGSEALFSNWGYYIDNRLRVYVPEGTSTNGNTYLQLYKNKFASNAQYIFLTGSSVGSYYHYAVPYDLTNYTVREVTIDDYQDNPITGWEIVSYQGADLSSSYNIPASLTVGSTTQNVISIGNGAYSNAVVTSGQVVNLSSANLLNIGDHAFYNLGISSITANNVVTIGEYALANTNMETASFDHLSVIDDNALSDNDNLYDLNLGNVSILGSNSVGDNPDLEIIKFTNTDLNTLLVGTPFADSGTNAGSRLRIYVPNGDTYIDYYKDILDTPDYVYGTGSVVGSYTDSNGHDIGQYTVRSVTKNNYSGTPITGWEIIEYHGANLTSGYSIPTTFTVGATTYDVISIGREAYYHTLVTNGNTLTLTNTNLINIGQNAFYNMQGIGTLTASGVTTIGTKAFENSTITAAVFAHLNTIATLAFANNETLYSINLGTVKTMAENSVYNADKLSQVFFTATDLTLSFDTDALTDIGSLTNDRLRLYVTDGNSSGGTPWVDVYKGLFSSTYTSYFYRMGSIIGSYQQTNIPYDIGNYTLREVTLQNYLGSNVTGWELIEYHGADLPTSYTFPGSITIGATTHDVISIGEYAYVKTASVETAIIDISSTALLKIGKEAFYNVDRLNSVTANYVTSLGEKAFQNTSLVSASFSHLTTTGDYALANISTLNMVHLGNTTTFGAYLLYQDDSIEQIFMTSTAAGTTLMNFTIGSNAFTGVATSIGDRLRIYVPDGIAAGSTTYVTLYKATLPSNVNPYVYATGSLTGSFTQYPETYNIGEYMVKEVTINGNNGWEIVDYHGANITTSYTVPTDFTINSVNKTVVSIGEYAYYFAVLDSGQTWTLNLPSTVTKIGTYAFYKRNIVGVAGNIMFTIGQYAFAECPGLAAVSFEETRTIDAYAFYLNTSLTYVSVGIGGTNYGNYAFYQTAAANVLAEFRVMNTTPPTIYTYTLPPNTGTIKPTIYVPYSAYTAYNNASIWSTYTKVRVNTPYLGVWNYSIINTNEIHIISYTGNKQTADIPDYFTLDSVNFNVTSLGASAFPAVQTRYIDIPRYMNIININVLGNTKRIQSFTVDANNTTFSASNGVLFNYGATVLIKYPDNKSGSSYTVPSGVTAIASTAFATNTDLTTLSFPSSLVVIAHDAFSGCTNMRTYNFAGTTPPILPAFLLFPYYSNMYINVPNAALSTYQNHYAYYYYRARIYGV